MRLRLRTAEFDRLARAILGEDTDGKIAERLGTHFTTLSQYRRGARYVPAEFVAACKSEMPDVPIDAIFEAVPERAA
jgi:DNA-binding transcriptional regulator YdaS (Cro superfamily)